jgi:hypothetical protein
MIVDRQLCGMVWRLAVLGQNLQWSLIGASAARVAEVPTVMLGATFPRSGPQPRGPEIFLLTKVQLLRVDGCIRFVG